MWNFRYWKIIQSLLTQEVLLKRDILECWLRLQFTRHILLAFCAAAKNARQNFVTLYTSFQTRLEVLLVSANSFRYSESCRIPRKCSQNVRHMWTHQSNSILRQKTRCNLSPCGMRNCRTCLQCNFFCSAAICECFHLFTTFVVKCAMEMRLRAAWKHAVWM